MITISELDIEGRNTALKRWIHVVHELNGVQKD
jgi:hypothetical protein